MSTRVRVSRINKGNIAAQEVLKLNESVRTLKRDIDVLRQRLITSESKNLGTGRFEDQAGYIRSMEGRIDELLNESNMAENQNLAFGGVVFNVTGASFRREDEYFRSHFMEVELTTIIPDNSALINVQNNRVYKARLIPA